MNAPITIVCGFGRCGTSLVMQMLAAAEIPTTGRYPAFEAEQTNPIGFDGEWLAQQAGKAVKVLDPHRPEIKFVRGPAYRVILLERNRRQQALSQLKLMRVMFGALPNVPMECAITATERSYKRDRPRVINKLGTLTQEVLRLDFEDLIKHPLFSAAVIAAFCGIEADRIHGGLRRASIGQVRTWDGP
jgi:hypothetical protein